MKRFVNGLSSSAKYTLMICVEDVPGPESEWHLDEKFIKINGKDH